MGLKGWTNEIIKSRRSGIWETCFNR
jgi:hypothetical protein